MYRERRAPGFIAFMGKGERGKPPLKSFLAPLIDLIFTSRLDLTPRWPSIRVGVRSRRFNRKIGDFERSTTIQCLANYNPSSVKALRKLSCWLSLAALDRGTLDSKTTQNNNSDSGIQVTEFSTWTSGPSCSKAD